MKYFIIYKFTIHWNDTFRQSYLAGGAAKSKASKISGQAPASVLRHAITGAIVDGPTRHSGDMLGHACLLGQAYTL